MKLKDVCLFFLWKKSYDKPRQHIKKQRHYFANKGLSSWSYGFSSSHMDVRVDHKETECWRINWCFWTVVLEKTLEIPLDCKEIQPVYPKGNQSWIFIGRTDAEAPIFWPPDAKNWLIWKDPDAGKDWRQEEKGMTEEEMVGWHHRLDGHEFEQALGVGDGQASLVCCSPWGHKELNMTEQLNGNEFLFPRLVPTHITWLPRLSSINFKPCLSNTYLFSSIKVCIISFQIFFKFNLKNWPF